MNHMNLLRPAIAAIMLVAAPITQSVASADTTETLDTGCPAGVAPGFVDGTPFAILKSSLGDAMGAPVSCVITDQTSGDAMQFTDTGLAEYVAASDLAMFTNGDRHWALSGGTVVQWDQGAILQRAIPPGAVPATLPVDATPVPYCGVDVVTDVHAHTDQSGAIQSNTVEKGVASKCFDAHFRACTPAIMATYLVVASYRDRIDGPGPDGRCRVVSNFVDNVNPGLVGKQMTCDLDNSRSVLDAIEDRSRCSGPLYDLLYAAGS
jgi:hypothetical protein